jgi:hypothetical protein
MDPTSCIHNHHMTGMPPGGGAAGVMYQHAWPPESGAAAALGALGTTHTIGNPPPHHLQQLGSTLPGVLHGCSLRQGHEPSPHHPPLGACLSACGVTTQAQLGGWWAPGRPLSPLAAHWQLHASLTRQLLAGLMGAAQHLAATAATHHHQQVR